MGSKFGKSTCDPTGTARTCGVNLLSFCTISARRVEIGTACPLPTGSSHTTTPEKSFRLRATWLFCPVSSTMPVTEAPSRAANSTTRRLELISERKIIVVIQAVAHGNIGRAQLRSLKTGQYVRRQPVEE